MINPFDKMRHAVDGDEAVIKEAEDEDRRNELLLAGQNPDEVEKILAPKKVIPKKKDWTKRFEERKEIKAEETGEQFGPDIGV